MHRRPFTLLVVDDDPDIVHLIECLVQRKIEAPVKLIGQHSLSAALHWLDDSPCDLVLSDIELPDGDGMTLLPAAKSRNAWTQVVFMTGHSSWDRIASAIEHGAIDYLVKPFAPNALVEVLSENIRRCQRWQRALHGTLTAPATST